MGYIVDGPKPHRVPVNVPFERLPQCGCDSGSGPTFTELKERVAELEAALSKIYRETYPGDPVREIAGKALGL